MACGNAARKSASQALALSSLQKKLMCMAVPQTVSVISAAPSPT